MTKKLRPIYFCFKIIVGLIISLLCMFCFLLYCCCRLEFRHAFYKNKADITKSNYDRGWIPSCLPDASYNIRETHSIDGALAERRITFQMPINDFKLQVIPNNCKVLLDTKEKQILYFQEVYYCNYFKKDVHYYSVMTLTPNGGEITFHN